MYSNFDQSKNVTSLNEETLVENNELAAQIRRTEVECSKIDVNESMAYFKSLKLSYDSTGDGRVILPKPFSNNKKFSGVDNIILQYWSLDAAANARFRWKSSVVSWICTTHKLNDDLKIENDLIHAIAQSSFNWEDSVHCRMIQTVFKKLTGTCFDCPQFGSHWQLIGFQGSDPSTDLRGVGLFGLLQMLYLCTNEFTTYLARKLYKVSNSESQPFPLAVLSLNVTQITMSTLRSGKLYKECNNRQSVLQVVNLFYVALLNYICNVWITEHKTIKDSGYLLKDADKYCSKNIRKILQELPSQLDQHKS